MSPQPKRALDGVRVLDFSRVLAGPFCTMQLADLGAEVIKIEQPGAGDETRAWGPPWAGGLSAYYLSVNRNKQSVALNLKHAEAQSIARQLALKSHVVIENFKVGQMAGFGLDFETLRKDNPALVYCSITGFGQDSPYSDRPGYDYVIQAMSGLMSITGDSDGNPTKVGVAVSDVFTGLFAAQSILAALRHAERTGEGQSIDVALLDSQMAALVNVASNFLISSQVPPRLGDAHPNIVPYQTFRAADQHFVLAVGNDRQFAQLCALIERPEWASDPRYASNPARVEHRVVLVELLNDIFRTRTADAWVEALLAQGIPAGPINSVADIFNTPYAKARGMVQTMTLHDGTAARLVGPAAKLSATPADIRTAPPTIGQDTAQVLRAWLALTDTEIAHLREIGAIG